MEYVNIKGIVVKNTDYLESDRLLTILSFEKGMITVKAKSVRKKGAKLSHCTQLFFCGDFECIVSKERYILIGGNRIYDYTEIAMDIEKYYYACHYADIASAVIMENNPEEQVLRLLLNTLHIMIKGDIDLILLKAIYELRIAVLTGFAPITDECAICGGTSRKITFSIKDGGTICCGEGIPVDRHVINALKHIVESDMKNLFSIKVATGSLSNLCMVSRKYLEYILDRKFEKLKKMNEL